VESNASLIATSSSALVKRNNEVFALIPSRIARTTDDGGTWAFGGRLTASRLVGSGQSLFAATFDGVSRSNDNGVTWTPANQGITEYLPDLRDLAVTEDAVYASFYYIISLHGTSNWFSGGVFRSTDNGELWVPVNNGLPRDAFSVVAPTHRVAAHGQLAFAATVAGVFKSTNGGADWVTAGTGIPASTWVEALHVSSGYVVCGTNRGVFRYNGSAWEPLSNGFPQPNGPYAYNFAEYNGSLYAATSIGVYRFDGSTWTVVGTGEPASTSVSSIVEVNGDLFASVPGKGVWRYSLVVSAEEASVTPTQFSLDQNYPNPFNPTTKIKFQIASDGVASLKVYDLLGREVLTLVNENLRGGSHETTFDATGLVSGVYFCRLEARTYVQTRRMLLLK
jgi:hypothetical protein